MLISIHLSVLRTYTHSNELLLLTYFVCQPVGKYRLSVEFISYALVPHLFHASFYSKWWRKPQWMPFFKFTNSSKRFILYKHSLALSHTRMHAQIHTHTHIHTDVHAGHLLISSRIHSLINSHTDRLQEPSGDPYHARGYTDCRDQGLKQPALRFQDTCLNIKQQQRPSIIVRTLWRVESASGFGRSLRWTTILERRSTH